MTLSTKIIYLLAAFDKMFIHVYSHAVLHTTVVTSQANEAVLKTTVSSMKFHLYTYPKIKLAYFQLLLEYVCGMMFNETGILSTNLDIYILVHAAITGYN